MLLTSSGLYYGGYYISSGHFVPCIIDGYDNLTTLGIPSGYTHGEVSGIAVVDE
jgi:hypothetical protein